LLAWLPDKLPARTDPIWETSLSAPGLGGVAATAEFVFVSDRELNDTVDVFRCLNATDGKEKWAHRTPAIGNLDYGNSPRATPLIHNGFAYCLGAFGDLACLDVKTGKAQWAINLRDEFDVTEERKWGVCDSPLIADGKLIVAPGGKETSLVALDPKTGKPVWKTPGKVPGYGSFISATIHKTQQIIGYDAETLGGWDAKTGKRLWTLKPERGGDFNVPTPIMVGDKLLVTTENNGTRLFAFKSDGTLDPKPVATHKRFAPDTHTPVVVGDRVFGVWNRFYCLNAKDNLKEVYDESATAFSGYCAVVASESRVMVIPRSGELLLLDATANEYTELSKWKPFGKDEKGVYSHPAFVGTRMYLRGSASIVCLELSS
jgi:outer membrane protein assembly factor BamB